MKHFRLQLKPQTKAKYKCEECATSVLNYRKLKVHIKTYHTHSKSSQYENDYNFEAYPCFYCDEPITCASDIEDHETVCLSVSEELLQAVKPLQKPNIFPCLSCGLLCTSMEDLLGHMNTFHPREPDVTLASCTLRMIATYCFKRGAAIGTVFEFLKRYIHFLCFELKDKGGEADRQSWLMINRPI